MNGTVVRVLERHPDLVPGSHRRRTERVSIRSGAACQRSRRAANIEVILDARRCSGVELRPRSSVRRFLSLDDLHGGHDRRRRVRGRPDAGRGATRRVRDRRSSPSTDSGVHIDSDDGVVDVTTGQQVVASSSRGCVCSASLPASRTSLSVWKFAEERSVSGDVPE